MKHSDIDHTGITGVGGDLSAHTGDATDAHDASAISVLDTAANFTGSDVEAVLAELQDNIDGVSVGGGGAQTIQRFDSAAAPGSPSAQDDEFEDASIGGGLTRVYNSGTPKGTWSEGHGGIGWKQTATSATELDVYAQARTISVGDYVEAGGRVNITTAVTLGLAIGFSNGTTFGTSNALASFWHSHTTSPFNRFMMNPWPGHNTRSTDSTIFDKGMLGDRWYIRVKYEAANTWGLYVSPNGHAWHTVQSNFAYTMTPTHVIFGVSMITGQTAPNFIDLDYFRVNAA